MKILITALTKNERKGLYVKTTTPDIRRYLLGHIKKFETTEQLHYVPKYVSYIRETTPANYIEKYFGFVMQGPRRQRINTMTSDKRRSFMGYVVESPLLRDFLSDYRTFMLKYPEFIENVPDFYRHFKIPKKKATKLANGKFVIKKRPIDEPIEELMVLQKAASKILYDVLRIKHHDAAHAYTKKRDNVTNAKTHQYSNHFLLMDFKNFFGSINPEFLRKQLCMLKEFAIINVEMDKLPRHSRQNYWQNELAYRYKDKMTHFVNALITLAPLMEFLPQGSPLSPILSNIVMTEFDIALQKEAYSKRHCRHKIMYTRFADDLALSSFSPINKETIVQAIEALLVDTPVELNHSKTKYLTNRKRVYITGVKLNSAHQTTYGHEKKAELKQEIFNLIMAKKNGEDVSNQAMQVLGRFAYLKKIEPGYANDLIRKYANKFNIPVRQIYKYLIQE